VAYTLISAAHIVVGELAPKSWAIQQPERLSVAVAYPLHAFYLLFRPAIVVLNGLAAGLLRRVGIAPAKEHELSHSAEELQMIVAASGESGELRASEVDLVKQVFEFADRVARDVMLPRVDVVCLDAAWSLERARAVARRHPFTRYPLCEGDPDHITGMINIRDFILLDEDARDLRLLRREILFVPETKPLDQLLREFQRRRMHMAVVLDEYGGTAGILTLEDVLEQIVGEIHDENEEPEPVVQLLDDGAYLVDGRVLLTDLAADHQVHLPGNGAETVAGWVLSQLGAIPTPGQLIEAGDYRVLIEDLSNKRVRRVCIRPRVADLIPGDQGPAVQ
jgi:CBS domain containing-hemolysin-like protein